MNDLDLVAKEIYDYACTNRKDNKSKNPREVSCEFENLLDTPKEFYRSVARWHLAKQPPCISKVFDEF